MDHSSASVGDCARALLCFAPFSNDEVVEVEVEPLAPSAGDPARDLLCVLCVYTYVCVRVGVCVCVCMCVCVYVCAWLCCGTPHLSSLRTGRLAAAALRASASACCEQTNHVDTPM
jgi:hypothetical protein